MDDQRLRDKALMVRQKVMEMAVRANSGHISTAFSQADMLVALYYAPILKYKADDPKWDKRDRFILSKGQGGLGLYPILADLGFFPEEELGRFAQPGSILGVHAEWRIPGVEVLTGSLGHGLPMATGMAMAAREQGRNHFVVCMLGDGELYEGSNWEAMFTASHQQLGHLICIVDRNMQATIGRTDDVRLPSDGPRLEPLDKKFEAFGFETSTIDGHSFEEIEKAFTDIRIRPLTGNPVCIISRTIKGKGIKAMEDGSFFPTHYRVMYGKDLQAALRDLGMDADKFKESIGESVGY